jgi:hypothetical protein
MPECCFSFLRYCSLLYRESTGCQNRCWILINSVMIVGLRLIFFEFCLSATGRCIWNIYIFKPISLVVRLLCLPLQNMGDHSSVCLQLVMTVHLRPWPPPPKPPVMSPFWPIWWSPQCLPMSPNVPIVSSSPSSFCVSIITLSGPLSVKDLTSARRSPRFSVDRSVSLNRQPT